MRRKILPSLVNPLWPTLYVSLTYDQISQGKAPIKLKHGRISSLFKRNTQKHQRIPNNSHYRQPRPKYDLECLPTFRCRFVWPDCFNLFRYIVLMGFELSHSWPEKTDHKNDKFSTRHNTWWSMCNARFDSRSPKRRWLFTASGNTLNKSDDCFVTSSVTPIALIESARDVVRGQERNWKLKFHCVLFPQPKFLFKLKFVLFHSDYTLAQKKQCMYYYPSNWTYAFELNHWLITFRNLQISFFRKDQSWLLTFAG